MAITVQGPAPSESGKPASPQGNRFLATAALRDIKANWARTGSAPVYKASATAQGIATGNSGTVRS